MIIAIWYCIFKFGMLRKLAKLAGITLAIARFFSIGCKS